MTRPILALAIAIAVAPTGLAAQEVWELWSRPDSPVVLEVPDSLFDARVKTAERDRIAWETASGDIALVAFALPPGYGDDPAAFMAGRMADYPDRTVTYEAGGDTWRVVSGYEAAGSRTIYYERVEVGPDGRWAGLTLTWDESRRADVDALVGRIANSLALR